MPPLAPILLAVIAALHPSLPLATVPQGLGMNIHFTKPQPGELEMMQAAGCHWVRMDFGWAATERAKEQDDFTAYEDLMRSLRGHGMHAVFILDYGNPLYGNERSVVSEEGISAFSRWAVAAVDHFKGQGILWEIWNEPNGGFWNPKANVQEYATLALAASRAIRESVPGEAIIGPATSEVDIPFLQACFQAGLLDYWDAVSVHPYRQDGPESVALDYSRLRRLIAQYAPRNRLIPIISGEWGYSSAWQNYDPVRQGKHLAREWLTNLSQRIPLSIWYDWHEDGTNATEGEHHFGMVRHDYYAGREPVYDPKPAYLAAQTLTTKLRGFQFMRRLSTGSADDYLLLFVKGGQMALAAWTTAAPHTIRVPATKGDFQVTSHLGDPLPVSTAADGVLEIAATDAPLYLIAGSLLPNNLLAHVPAAHPLRATLFPVMGKNLGVRVEALDEAPFSGSVRLTDIQGLAPEADSQNFALQGTQTEKTLNFPLTFSAIEEYQAGVRIESPEGLMLDLPPQRFRSSAEGLLDDCRVFSDGDAKVASREAIAVEAAPEPLPFGPAAVTLRISYQFDPGWRFLVIGPKEAALRKIEGEPRAFGCWIFGDGGQQLPRLRVVDAQGQTWQPSGETIRWTGWRYVEFKLDASTAHWGGTKDGVIHYPLRWDATLLIDNGPRTAAAGTLWSTPPVLIY